MNEKEIKKFLIRAKKNTYAGKGPENCPSRPESHDLEYSEGDLYYLDTYLGGKKFAGEEALWENGLPIWAMNYYGRVLAAGFNGDFLKKALLNVPLEMPFRGPAEFKEGEFLYRCEFKGNFNYFTGYEAIYLTDNKIYDCSFHGGSIE